MRVAQVSTLATPVRERGAGSVESLVYQLSDRLVRAGHDVTVFATGDSSPPCELVAAVPGPYGTKGAPDDWRACEWLNVCRAVGESSRFDVIHSHSYLNAVPLTGLARAPIVHTMHILPHDSDARVLEHSPRAAVTAVSRSQWAAFPQIPLAGVVLHGVDPAAHTYRAERGDYLCFLGRFLPGKGPVEAIAAARELGLPLRMAGPRSDFYDQAIAPHVDGARVEYLGPIGGDERDALLSGAAALLYPINDPEPFGLVMVEAMMSGTPVAALDAGAVREIVEAAVTGAIVQDPSSLPEAVRACLALDRRGVRARAAQRFDAGRMAAEYEAIYRRVAVAESTAA